MTDWHIDTRIVIDDGDGSCCVVIMMMMIMMMMMRRRRMMRMVVMMIILMWQWQWQWRWWVYRPKSTKDMMQTIGKSKFVLVVEPLGWHTAESCFGFIAGPCRAPAPFKDSWGHSLCMPLQFAWTASSCAKVSKFTNRPGPSPGNLAVGTRADAQICAMWYAQRGLWWHLGASLLSRHVAYRAQGACGTEDAARVLQVIWSLSGTSNNRLMKDANVQEFNCSGCINECCNQYCIFLQ